MLHRLWVELDVGRERHERCPGQHCCKNNTSIGQKQVPCPRAVDLGVVVGGDRIAILQVLIELPIRCQRTGSVLGVPGAQLVVETLKLEGRFQLLVCIPVQCTHHEIGSASERRRGEAAEDVERQRRLIVGNPKLLYRECEAAADQCEQADRRAQRAAEMFPLAEFGIVILLVVEWHGNSTTH